ncbi:MAG TPA: DEAD/DEAH box helicase [Acidobacteriaceae bacterium]|nr:DEAD/DEAH box helicase [Acidobacteriaceae bacterium]
MAPRGKSSPGRSRTSAGAGTTADAQAEGAGAALGLFHPITEKWFREALGEPTAPQREGWPAIARGESTLILAPTGTGKTLAAFLWCLDRLVFAEPEIGGTRGCRVVYLSPLKALAADVEKNLQRPLEGIAAMAREDSVDIRIPQITMRTGDTPAKERALFLRHPGDILITTPESLYLMLTSRAGEMLRSVETVIVDEIHAMVPTKRGAHLALSLERLEALVRASGGGPLQRIGLSATQRPLEEVARFLGGTEASESASQQVSESADEVPASAIHDGPQGQGTRDTRYRPVTIVNAGARKQLELRVEIPVEDMARLSIRPEGEKEEGPKRTSIWQSMYPKVLEIIQRRRSTLIFVNARRVAERMAAAINELAGEPIARAHHGSLAAAQRKEIEDLLKAGEIKALVATSSLELGIDMGAIDLVIQIEAPPSVASGMQRIGRAGHQVGAASHGILIPKYRSDLVACAAVTQAMHEGHVESTRYLRNPLDVLAQQIVAIVAHPPMGLAEPERTARRGDEDAGPGIAYQSLYEMVRGAAPFAALSRAVFNGVLDMLSGLYPSDEFAELRPRVTWDRERGWLTPRTGVKRIAIMNGGTIPDRGLYGVFLSGERDKPVRVGELDEEMVFESKAGEVFLLGASAWRIDEITQDRVLVSPAPGEAGKMPFWHGDRAGRPMEFGRRIGALVRELRAMPQAVAIAALVKQHDLDANAAENLLRYLADQESSAGVIPDDATVLIERVRDELGFWRVCVLTPFGSRIHAPWGMAAAAKVAAAGGPSDVELMWSEDGFVLRFPDTEEPPAIAPFLPTAAEASELVTAQLGQTVMFAAKFREAASRALLLPRRRMDGRTPLWQQRKRAYDLLSVASRFASFPILLEAYRECLRDVFDMPALAEVLRGIESGTLNVRTVDSQKPSPFASALLFSYVANYIYDGDAPLAERRAQALSIDQDQLRELMGDADLRELLDARAIEETEEQLQAVAEGYRARGVDSVHDLLLRIGDLSLAELQKRIEGDSEEFAKKLLRAKRAVEIEVANDTRLIAAEDAGRYRDALGVKLPGGLPEAFLARVPDAATDLLRRFARTHGPFTAAECAERFGMDLARAESLLEGLVAAGRVAEGGFRPGGVHREWCDVEVLRTIRRKSLARLRKEVEPVDQRVLARMVTRWQGVVQPRRGLDALLDAIESLQGAAVPASILETEILPARISGYKPADLDTLIAAGEVVWVGMEPLGERDGRVGLYLAETLAALWSPNLKTNTGVLRSAQDDGISGEREERIVEFLRERGASFFQQIHDSVGGGFPGETLDALWGLAWRGLVLNDTMHALRAYTARSERAGKRVHVQGPGFRSRRTTPPAAQGRWSVNAAAFAESSAASATNWSHAMTQQLLTRYGVVFRETAYAEGLPGGFSAVYDVLKAMEESGKVRRGYFVAELGATQFAPPAAVELLRTLRTERQSGAMEMVMLAATDPANPYGALLKWPDVDASTSLTRSVGAKVVLCDGCLGMYLRRGNPNVQVFLPEDEPERSQVARALAEFLVARVRAERDESANLRRGLLIATVNGVRVGESPMAQPLLEAGFAVGAMGFYVRRPGAHTERVLPGGAT